MVNGKLVRRGTPEAIRADVVGAYLGSDIEVDESPGGSG